MITVVDSPRFTEREALKKVCSKIPGLRVRYSVECRDSFVLGRWPWSPVLARFSCYGSQRLVVLYVSEGERWVGIANAFDAMGWIVTVERQ